MGGGRQKQKEEEGGGGGRRRGLLTTDWEASQRKGPGIQQLLQMLKNLFCSVEINEGEENTFNKPELGWIFFKKTPFKVVLGKPSWKCFFGGCRGPRRKRRRKRTAKMQPWVRKDEEGGGGRRRVHSRTRPQKKTFLSSSSVVAAAEQSGRKRPITSH